LIKDQDFVKCGSPLGEYELHLTIKQKQELLSDLKAIQKIKTLLNSKTIQTKNTIFYHPITVKEVLCILEDK